ncbi:MAG: hypothetical protein B6D72_11095 [gamma proteobacterium symbiont of Ctena orbiculata]|nr:DUF4157 domain-containing protein [Candidatus Thiodiazotropha taylori]PUB83663.1 MAG: hypothetical protein DBP00_15825 [gamma proteobacterium symbiont of Ctena orbiculata]MBT2997656.1 DUF4157 domain-containing protein [Candidatus Thiodiazotropha taylori]MBT3001923.1 DUF4157 domain-containing protein [Candidatus Thiodiazotropha taylori]MBT3026315.1 DUF4157 domain-containing protein [Candidatus Thiodiazotropha taylori]
MSRTQTRQALATTSGSEGQRGKAANLRISQPGDRSELEADRIADEVLRMPEPNTALGDVEGVPIQRKCAACEAGGAPCRACSLSAAPLPVSRTHGMLQRQPIEEEEELQLKSQPEAKADPTTGGGLKAVETIRRGGSPLPDPARGYFEPRFGRDLSDVRVHTGQAAAQATEAVNARAFTLGRSIAFAPGQFDPGGARGRKLLAHELAHVVQQGGVPRHSGEPVAINTLPAGDRPPILRSAFDRGQEELERQEEFLRERRARERTLLGPDLGRLVGRRRGLRPYRPGTPGQAAPPMSAQDTEALLQQNIAKMRPDIPEWWDATGMSEFDSDFYGMPGRFIFRGVEMSSWEVNYYFVSMAFAHQGWDWNEAQAMIWAWNKSQEVGINPYGGGGDMTPEMWFVAETAYYEELARMATEL